MPNAPLILALLFNLLLSFKSSNNKKYLSLMSSVIVVTAQEKSQLNVAKQEFPIHKLFSTKKCVGYNKTLYCRN
jgi:hypothetical protein